MAVEIKEIEKDISGSKKKDAVVVVDGVEVTAETLIGMLYGENPDPQLAYALARKICAGTFEDPAVMSAAKIEELRSLMVSAAQDLVAVISMLGKADDMISEIHRLVASCGGSTMLTALAIAGSKSELPGKLEESPNKLGLVARATYSLLNKLKTGIVGEMSIDAIDAINAFKADKVARK